MFGLRVPQTKEARLAYRSIFIPKGAVKVQPKGMNVVFYLSSQLRKGLDPKTREVVSEFRIYRAMCFIGNAAKPTWDYTYRTEKQRDEAIRDQIERSKRSAVFKEERKAAMNVERKVKVGDIFATSWGYNMTNVDFYQVVELVGKTSARVRAIGATSRDTGYLSGYCKPVKDMFLEGRFAKEFVVRVRGDHCKIDDHYASLTSGEREHYWNHCD